MLALLPYNSAGFIKRDIERYLDKSRAGPLEEFNGLELIIYPIIISTSVYVLQAYSLTTLKIFSKKVAIRLTHSVGS